MKKFYITFITTILFVFSVNAQDTLNTTELDSLLNRAFSDFELTGLSVGVVKDSQIVFTKSYGYRVWDTNKKINSETLFGIASLSKAFTAASIGMLVDEGKLSFDDRVIDHLPWFDLYDPYITRELRIEDLLTHRAGYRTFDGDLLWYGSNHSREEILNRFQKMPNRNGFRNNYGYSNIMFLAAGEVIEAVSGMTWDEFINERIFKPLQMNESTTTNAGFNETMNIALPHLYREPVDFISYDNIAPAASINSSVDDLLKWLNMWLHDGTIGENQILSKRTLNRILSSYMAINVGHVKNVMGRHFMNTGMGWFLSDSKGRKVIQHGGGLPGFISNVTIVPEEKLGIVILMNDMGFISGSVVNYILDSYTGFKEEKNYNDYFGGVLKYFIGRETREAAYINELDSLQVQNTNTSLNLTDYAGTYNDEMYGDASVELIDGELKLTLIPTKGLFTAELNHYHYDTFRFRFADPYLPEGLVTFELNNKGGVEGFKIDLPNPDFHFSNLHFIKQ
ncbi:MAG: serine hydrolase [Melioribacteraceae bacterium]|nr:serine hydrolase [Melioribacteraceae bacterium]MCF8356739.1 serine hydrolase [Melioribacteraceae bacterium]MCF8395962.1 serine hydrolase [Melioribacteraceae bacterium]MCF8419525.1 serine hydrolase [Melioribacteraceae bacterium]